jgi:hypothetical protein
MRRSQVLDAPLLEPRMLRLYDGPWLSPWRQHRVCNISPGHGYVGDTTSMSPSLVYSSLLLQYAATC